MQAQLVVFLTIFFIFALNTGNAEWLEVLGVELFHDQFAVARVGLHLVIVHSPPNDAVQNLPFNGATNSVSDTLGLGFVFIFQFILHPIKIPNVSARQVVVAVCDDAHVRSGRWRTTG